VSDKIVESVIDQFRTRAEAGKRKYGTTMAHSAGGRSEEGDSGRDICWMLTPTGQLVGERKNHRHPCCAYQHSRKS